MSDHEKYSPSRHPMLANCPGWMSGESGEAAERGTRIHAIIEDFLTKSHRGMEVHADEIASADNAIRWFNEVLRPAHPEITNWMFEKKVTGLLPDTGGTLDVVGIDDFYGTVVAVDWKSGSKYYDAATNEQGHVHVINTAKFWGAKAVVFYFYNCDTGQSSSHTFSGGDMDRLRDDAEARIVMADTAERTGHGLRRFYGCDWCGRKLTCQEYRKSVDTAVSAPIVDVKALSAADLGAMLDRYAEPAAAVAEFIKALKARAVEVIQAGGEIPGYTVTERGGQRKWKDPESAAMASVDVKLNLLDWVTPAEAERRMKKAGVDIAKLGDYTVQTTTKSLTKDKT